MASACVNQILDTSSPSWFSPRMSFSHDFALNQDPTKSPRNGDVDFEFFVRDPTKISPADELFLNGKLVPLQITSRNEDDEEEKSGHESHDQFAVEEEKECEKIVINEIFGKGTSASPKAPKCSWKELLGLKRSQNSNIPKSDSKNSKSLKFFRSKSSSSSSSSPMNLPLLKDVDAEAESVLNSSRFSLSSSSSGADHDGLPRLSLDSEKPKMPKLKVTRPKLQKLQKSSRPGAGARTGRSATRRAASESGSRGASLESPRMNPSGKIVFHGLERSSSSPSSFNGGPKLKARGMERSYSANVRIRPVLNVPVCSLRRSSKSGSVFGFGQLFSSQKKDGATKNHGIKRNGSGSNR